MTTTEMLSLLSIYTEDSTDNQFSQAQKVIFLNLAQRYIIPLLHRKEVHVLDTTLTAQIVDSDGAIDLALLNPGVYRNDKGLDYVRITDGDACRLISFQEYRQSVDTNFVFSSDRPAYYIRGTKAFFLPFEASVTSIDIHYMKKLVDMTAAPVNSELEENLHDIIVEVAAYYAFRSIADMNRANGILENALISIRKINEQYPATDSNSQTWQQYGDFMGFNNTINYPGNIIYV